MGVQLAGARFGWLISQHSLIEITSDEKNGWLNAFKAMSSHPLVHPSPTPISMHAQAGGCHWISAL